MVVTISDLERDLSDNTELFEMSKEDNDEAGLITIEADARYLYGAPGSNLEITGEVTIRATEEDSIPGLPGYSAGLEDDECLRRFAPFFVRQTNDGGFLHGGMAQ